VPYFSTPFSGPPSKSDYLSPSNVTTVTTNLAKSAIVVIKAALIQSVITTGVAENNPITGNGIKRRN
jgi:hypothetical protein